jgi:hypothetical protein
MGERRELLLTDATFRDRSRPVDRLFLRAAPDGFLPTGYILDVDGEPPTLHHLRRRVADRAGALPALHRLPPSAPAGRWRPTGPPHIATHVRELHVEPEGVGGIPLEQHVLRRPLPTGDAPPWDLWLVTDGSAKGYRLCFRVHHAAQDGVGAAHTVAALLNDGTHGGSGPSAYHPTRPRTQQLAAAVGDLTRTLHPHRHWPQLRRTARGRTSLVHTDIPVMRLRKLAFGKNATVNDIYLAALASAVRTWQLPGRSPGDAWPDLPVIVPMSTRRGGQEHEPGNHIMAMCVRLPTGFTPQQRLDGIKHQTGHAARGGRRDAAQLLLGAMPAPVAERVARRVIEPRAAPVFASSVAFQHPLHCFDSPVQTATLFSGLASGLLCYTSLTGHGDTARFAVVHDEALSGAAALPRLWLSAVAELERLPRGG